MDRRINDAHHVSGRFAYKPRRDGTPSNLLPLTNPIIKWAIRQEENVHTQKHTQVHTQLPSAYTKTVSLINCIYNKVSIYAKFIYLCKVMQSYLFMQSYLCKVMQIYAKLFMLFMQSSCKV